MTSIVRSSRFLMLLLASSLSFACAAQDDAHSREREALRRTQGALRQAQEQQAALSKEKDDLAAQRDKLADAARRMQTEVAAAHSDAGRINASLVHAEDEIAAMKTRDEAARKDLESKLADQAERLAEARRVADERAHANTTLAALLQQTTQSLAAAEKANQQMHAVGVQLIDRIRSRDGAASADAVFGFGQVRIENETEALRDRLDSARFMAPTSAPAVAR